MRAFVPRDSFAIACGAEAVVAALAAHATVVRTGSRGMAWLEPLVEIETAEGRIGFGPVTPQDVPAILAEGARHPLCIGRPEAHPFLARQTRISFRRCGLVDPLALPEMPGLARARAIGAAATLAEVVASGLRGRGGAGFPTGIKWQTAAAARGPRRAIVVNADEGDSGTFADRMLMEGDPFAVIEGILIAGFAVGADHAYIYSRSEYPVANTTLAEAIAIAGDGGLLAAMDIHLRIGAGAYVCGEETALLESLEGRRGMVRAKPPLPAHEGLFGRPTVVNNLLTIATVPAILADGAAAYAALGHGRSRGTMAVQLAGNVRHGGLFEVPFGLPLGALVEEIGGGTASGRPVRAVQAGGPLGAYFPPALFDTPYDYEAFAARDGLIGHGGLVVFDDSVDMAAQARFAMEFCALESCGKCTPCRIGAVRGIETIDRIRGGDATAIPLLEDLCQTMKLGSLCALGGFTPYPVMSALTHFREDFTR